MHQVVHKSNVHRQSLFTGSLLLTLKTEKMGLA